MRRIAVYLAACVAVVSAIGLYAQQADSIASTNNPPEVLQSVPRLIMFSGTVKDLAGKPLTGPVDLNFAIYKEQPDAAPLWQESQTLNVDEQGHYTALLGAMQPEGLPVDLFTSGEARWLGVSVGKLPEQARVLLVSVPYALKANDAEMLAGKPASAYALAPPAEGTASGGVLSGGTGTLACAGTARSGCATSDLATPGKPKSGANPNVAGTGTLNYIPRWTNSTGTLGNSVIFQSGNNIGFGTTSPIYRLDVVGGSARVTNPSGTAQLVVSGSASSGRLGQDAGGFFFSSDTNGGAVRFLTNNGSLHEWMRVTSAGNVGIGTTGPVSALNVAGTTGLTWTNGGNNLGLATFGTPATGGSLYLNTPSLSSSFQSGLGIDGTYGTPSQQSVINIRALGVHSGGGYGSQLAFWTTNGTVPNQQMTIDNAGNVGIGTTTPAAKLEVNGTAKFDGAVTFASADTFMGNQTVTGNLSASGQLISTVAMGTAPLSVASTTLVPNLNAAMLDGLPASAFQPAGAYAVTTGPNTFSADQTFNAALNLAQTTGADVGVINGGGYPFIHACCPKSLRNTFVGTLAGNFTADASLSDNGGGLNTGIGFEALQALTSGYANAATGYEALYSNTTGNYNTASGVQALYSNTTGWGNTASGYQALLYHSTGSYNTAGGYQALYSNTTGGDNTASGSDALSFNTTGNSNAATGAGALNYNTTGSYNTAVGSGALEFDCIYVSICAANNNTALGYQAGRTATLTNANITGANDTFLGANSGPGVNGTTTAISNATAIGANAVVSASNALVLGSINGVNGAAASVNVGIGTATPTTTLQVAGGDVSTTTAGSGVIVKSPDGTKCARIGIGNDGNLSVTAVTCP